MFGDGRPGCESSWPGDKIAIASLEKDALVQDDTPVARPTEGGQGEGLVVSQGAEDEGRVGPVSVPDVAEADKGPVQMRCPVAESDHLPRTWSQRQPSGRQQQHERQHRERPQRHRRHR